MKTLIFLNFSNETLLLAGLIEIIFGKFLLDHFVRTRTIHVYLSEAIHIASWRYCIRLQEEYLNCISVRYTRMFVDTEVLMLAVIAVIH